MSSIISSKSLAQYSVLALPLAFAGLPIYLLAPDFYATSYGLSLTTMGVCLLLLRLMDALIDPALGYLIDFWAHRFQHLIRLGVICMAIGIFILFWIPDQSQLLTLAWFCVAVFLTTLAYSLLTIGYGVQGAIWPQNRNDQVRITTSREGFTLVGLILAVTLPSVLSVFFNQIIAYRVLALILVLCLILAFSIYSRVQTPQPKTPQADDSADFKSITRALLGMLSAPSLLRLYWLYGLSVLASAIPAVLVIFFVRDYLQAYELIGLFLLLYFLSGALSMPFWRQLSNGLGKLQAWMISMALAICSFALVLLCNPGDTWFYAGICLATGTALGAELAIPPAILAEQVEQESRSAGLKYAGLTCLNKLSLSIAAGISLPILGLMGFEPGQPNSPDALMALLWIYGALPCVLKSAAFLGAFYWKNHLSQGAYVQT
jgi:GPH family glycoside/pentoside/hexuronide:cation symporter